MKISELLEKLKGHDPKEDVNMADISDAKNNDLEIKEDSLVTDDGGGANAKAPKEVEATAATPDVEKKEKSESAVEILLKKQAELEAKLAEMEAQNAELEARKQAIDAQSRLDKAQAEGWLLPYQLTEAEGVDSVFVELARKHPELFDRLHLVMAPKVIPKKAITEAPAGGNDAITEDELVARIKALAKDKGISYAQAAQMF